MMDCYLLVTRKAHLGLCFSGLYLLLQIFEVDGLNVQNRSLSEVNCLCSSFEKTQNRSVCLTIIRGRSNAVARLNLNRNPVPVTGVSFKLQQTPDTDFVISAIASNPARSSTDGLIRIGDLILEIDQEPVNSKPSMHMPQATMLHTFRLLPPHPHLAAADARQTPARRPRHARPPDPAPCAPHPFHPRGHRGPPLPRRPPQARCRPRRQGRLPRRPTPRPVSAARQPRRPLAALAIRRRRGFQQPRQRRRRRRRL